MNTVQELIKCYKLADQYELSDLVFGHISVRSDNGYYIKNQFVPFKNVTERDIKFISFDSKSSLFSDVGIHKSIYNSTDYMAIMHIHTDPICAISSSNEKIMNISQPAALVNTSYAEYEYECNLLFDYDHSKLIELTKNNEFILMKNHGFLTAGKTLQHVFFNSYIFDRACRIQLLSRNQIEYSEELIDRKRELKLLLKLYQTKKEMWENLTREL